MTTPKVSLRQLKDIITEMHDRRIHTGCFSPNDALQFEKCCYELEQRGYRVREKKILVYEKVKVSNAI